MKKRSLRPRVQFLWKSIRFPTTSARGSISTAAPGATLFPRSADRARRRTQFDVPKTNKANVLPPFLTENGPVREARFVLNRDGTPDGGVHDLFVISGRADALGCNIKQPNFADELARDNVVFRIPTPLFGLGLVENVSDDDLQAALAPTKELKKSLGISGRFNRTGNDGTITRFGWKAQNKSLLIF